MTLATSADAPMFATVTLMGTISPGTAVAGAVTLTTATSCSTKKVVVFFQLSERSSSIPVGFSALTRTVAVAFIVYVPLATPEVSQLKETVLDAPPLASVKVVESMTVLSFQVWL